MPEKKPHLDVAWTFRVLMDCVTAPDAFFSQRMSVPFVAEESRNMRSTRVSAPSQIDIPLNLVIKVIPFISRVPVKSSMKYNDLARVLANVDFGNDSC